MKLLYLALFLLSPALSFAQDVKYPTLPASVGSLNDFLPSKWFLKDSAHGDLNGDGSGDLAVVLESKDTVQERRPDGETHRTSPRILTVLLKDAKTGRYGLFLQNNTFIIRSGEGGMLSDAYGELSITKGILEIYISFLRGGVTYKFRMQNGDLYLIGGRNGGVSGGTYYGFDANFSIGKAKIEEGPIDEDKTKVKWVTLPKVPLKRLRDLKMHLQWEVIKDQYL